MKVQELFTRDTTVAVRPYGFFYCNPPAGKGAFTGCVELRHPKCGPFVQYFLANHIGKRTNSKSLLLSPNMSLKPVFMEGLIETIDRGRQVARVDGIDGRYDPTRPLWGNWDEQTFNLYASLIIGFLHIDILPELVDSKFRQYYAIGFTEAQVNEIGFLDIDEMPSLIQSIKDLMEQRLPAS